jgi:hypothetical protein
LTNAEDSMREASRVILSFQAQPWQPSLCNGSGGTACLEPGVGRGGCEH